ncbi:MAG: DUF1501 domain-containing protein, partial [Planctomycetaceae bacterium]|nr:DUF1501 domain-containing protein [Planctomycetaceae bacterium]
MNRRRLIQAGSLGSLGLGLPHLLRAGESSGSATARSCIFLILSGGPGQHETFDPKPHAPAEIRGRYKAIASATPGVMISEMLPQLAARTDQYCLVRSMSHTDPVHVTAAHTMLTGQPNATPADESPMIGSLVSRFRPADANLPSHIWLHNMKTGTNKVPRYDNGLQHVGRQHAAFRVGYELDNPASPDFRVRHFDPMEGVSSDHLARRYQLLRSVESESAFLKSAGSATAAYDTFQQKAFELIHRPSAREAFDLDQEPVATRERYGRHPLGQYLLMARRLV